MDNTMLISIAMFMFVRAMIVGVGGLSIALGYLLFKIPLEKATTGRISLPGVSVVISRSGPGVFFAAFGALVIYNVLSHPVTFEPSASRLVGAAPLVRPEQSAPPPDLPSVRPLDAPADEVKLHIKALNCLLETVGTRGDVDVPRYVLALRDAKTALMLGIWSSKEWGDPALFQLWTKTGNEPNIPEAVKQVFVGSLSSCQK
jgi:hypothetical protein